MKSINLLLGLLALLVSPLTRAQTTLTFDDINTQSILVFDNYAGFTWTDTGALNASTSGYVNSGYRLGTVSPDIVIFNLSERLASFGTDTPFTLNSLYVTPAWNTDLGFEMKGYFGGELQYTFTTVLTDSLSTFITLNWTGIDTVSFIGSGGTKNPLYTGNGTHVAIDNITINGPVGITPVPEPSTYGLLGAGALAGLGLVRRLRRRKAA